MTLLFFTKLKIIAIYIFSEENILLLYVDK